MKTISVEVTMMLSDKTSVVSYYSFSSTEDAVAFAALKEKEPFCTKISIIVGK